MSGTVDWARPSYLATREFTPQVQRWMASEIDRQARRIPLYDFAFYWQMLGRRVARR